MPRQRSHHHAETAISQNPKPHACEFPECMMAFSRPHDLKRHRLIHGDPKDRPYTCPYAGCKHNANQKGGVDRHINSRHKLLRISCDFPGCPRTFSDPSSLCTHRIDVHRAPKRSKGGRRKAQPEIRPVQGQSSKLRSLGRNIDRLQQTGECPSSVDSSIISQQASSSFYTTKQSERAHGARETAYHATYLNPTFLVWSSTEKASPRQVDIAMDSSDRRWSDPPNRVGSPAFFRPRANLSAERSTITVEHTHSIYLAS